MFLDFISHMNNCVIRETIALAFRFDKYEGNVFIISDV